MYIYILNAGARCKFELGGGGKRNWEREVWDTRASINLTRPNTEARGESVGKWESPRDRKRKCIYISYAFTCKYMCIEDIGKRGKEKATGRFYICI